MTTRDRLSLIAISVLVVLIAGWFLVVSPERKQASDLATQVTAAQAQLASAEGNVASATQARARYASAYASVVSLGKAVPPSEEVPSLIYQLAQASNQKHVEFNSITTGASGAGASASTPAQTTAATTLTAFTQMPFTFIFNGSFNDLYHLFKSLNTSTVQTASGDLRVSGRLLTLQAVKLEHTAAAAASGGGEKLTGTITATAYVLPADQGLTAGATPGSPAASAATSASSTPSGGASSSPAPVASIVGAR